MNNIVYQLLFSWVNLACAIVYVLTLGFYHPSWCMTFAKWYALKGKKNKWRV